MKRLRSPASFANVREVGEGTEIPQARLRSGDPIAVSDRGDDSVGTILVILVLVLLFGGGGGYYGYRNYGGPGLGGVLGLIVIVLVVVWLLGGLAGPPAAHV